MDRVGLKGVVHMVISLKFSKGRLRMATGAYTGDGTSSKFVQLPFGAKHVQIYQTGQTVRVWNKNDKMDDALSYKWTGVPALGTANEVTVSGTGFIVAGNANTGAVDYLWTAWG